MSLVGLLVGDIIFAASTPLGSNFMNPVLLVTAAIICGHFLAIFKTNAVYTWLTISFTALMAVSFFLIPQDMYLIWVVLVSIVTFILFFKKPPESLPDSNDQEKSLSKIWLIPAVGLLTAAGYFLDPVVSFAAEHSHAPKGIIGFVVLAALAFYNEKIL